MWVQWVVGWRGYHHITQITNIHRGMPNIGGFFKHGFTCRGKQKGRIFCVSLPALTISFATPIKGFGFSSTPFEDKTILFTLLQWLGSLYSFTKITKLISCEALNGRAKVIFLHDQKFSFILLRNVSNYVRNWIRQLRLFRLIRNCLISHKNLGLNFIVNVRTSL